MADNCDPGYENCVEYRERIDTLTAQLTDARARLARAQGALDCVRRNALLANDLEAKRSALADNLQACLIASERALTDDSAKAWVAEMKIAGLQEAMEICERGDAEDDLTANGAAERIQWRIEELRSIEGGQHDR